MRLFKTFTVDVPGIGRVHLAEILGVVIRRQHQLEREYEQMAKTVADLKASVAALTTAAAGLDFTTEVAAIDAVTAQIAAGAAAAPAAGGGGTTGDGTATEPPSSEPPA